MPDALPDTQVGIKVGQIWALQRRLPQIERSVDGEHSLVEFVGDDFSDKSRVVRPWDPAEGAADLERARINYCVAFGGGMEQNEKASRAPWTYPSQLGREVMHEAFEAIKAEEMKQPTLLSYFKR